MIVGGWYLGVLFSNWCDGGNVFFFAVLREFRKLWLLDCDVCGLWWVLVLSSKCSWIVWVGGGGKRMVLDWVAWRGIKKRIINLLSSRDVFDRDDQLVFDDNKPVLEATQLFPVGQGAIISEAGRAGVASELDPVEAAHQTVLKAFGNFFWAWRVGGSGKWVRFGRVPKGFLKSVQLSNYILRACSLNQVEQALG